MSQIDDAFKSEFQYDAANSQSGGDYVTVAQLHRLLNNVTPPLAVTAPLPVEPLPEP